MDDWVRHQEQLAAARRLDIEREPEVEQKVSVDPPTTGAIINGVRVDFDID